MICPKCKEEMPLLSKVCPVCGYVADGENGDSAAEMVDVLEAILRDVKALPKASFAKSMSKFAIFIVPILTLMLLFVSIKCQAGLFWILTILFVAWDVFLIVFKAVGRLGNAAADKKYARLKNDYEALVRTVRRDYGKNREVSKLLDDLSNEFAEVERQRRAANIRNIIIWAVLSIIVCALSVHGVISVNKIVDKVDEAAAQIDNIIKQYESQPDDDYNYSSRYGVLGKIVEAGVMTTAEQFFNNHCQGRVGDTECAMMIVRNYLKAGRKDDAKNFVVSVSLRYDSDKKKLEGLLNI